VSIFTLFFLHHSHHVCRCQGDKKDLDGDLSKLPRTRELTEMLVNEWSVSDLWGKFGIVSDIVVRTEFSFI
jgi:hypothetical protein